MTKTFTALAAAATIALGAIAMPQDADARGRGGAVAAGVIGGLAAGALVGSTFAGPHYGAYAYDYPAYGAYPGYGAYSAYGSECFVRRERFWNGFGWRIRRVRVCD
jgi:hypothetical protein